MFVFVCKMHADTALEPEQTKIMGKYACGDEFQLSHTVKSYGSNLIELLFGTKSLKLDIDKDNFETFFIYIKLSSAWHGYETLRSTKSQF